MVIAALAAFAVLLIAWIVAPGGAATSATPIAAPDAEPAPAGA
ncbi:MAG: hypothetical protein ACR2K4_08095 [Candidatus Limnocylindria bacterium]